MPIGRQAVVKFTFEVLIDNKKETIEVRGTGTRTQVCFRGQLLDVDVGNISENAFSLLINGRSYSAVVTELDGEFQVLLDGVAFEISLLDPKKFQSSSLGMGDAGGPASVLAPMPGKVVRVLVNAGDSVKEGQGVAVVEAMKMQNELKAPKAGKVEKVDVKENQTVNAGDSLMVVQ